MTTDQIMDALMKLAASAGRYGRLYEWLSSLDVQDREKWCARFSDCNNIYEFAMRLDMGD